METTLEPLVRGKVNDFAVRTFKRLAEDFRVLLPHPIAFMEGAMVKAGWSALVKHYGPLGVRIQGEAPSFEGEKFTYYLDQRMSYLMPGTLLMFPDPILVELVKKGEYNEDLQDAIGEIGNNLIGSLKRSIEPYGLGDDLVQGETVWEPGLMESADPEAVHIRGLFRYRKAKMMIVLTLPPLLLSKFKGAE